MDNYYLEFTFKSIQDNKYQRQKLAIALDVLIFRHEEQGRCSKDAEANSQKEETLALLTEIRIFQNLDKKQFQHSPHNGLTTVREIVTSIVKATLLYGLISVIRMDTYFKVIIKRRCIFSFCRRVNLGLEYV